MFQKNLLNSQNFSLVQDFVVYTKYINSILIEKVKVTKVVPQGSVLAPLLFNIYIAKINYNIGIWFAYDYCITCHENPEVVISELRL